METLPPEVPRGAWLDTARRVAPTPLPDTGTAELTRLGLAEEDVAEAGERFAEIAADPALRWIAERFATALTADAGRIAQPPPWDEPRRDWPVLPTSLGPAARWVYVPGFALAADRVRAAHRDRGIPAEVSDASLADLGRQMAIHRRVFGTSGLETHGWLTQIWGGGIVDVGRLQGEWLAAETVGLHIPETGPLRPAEVDASLARIRADWGTWFGERPRRAVCSSWLLDPQLAEWLPASSNIVGFQRRFTLRPGGSVDDQGPLYFVFRRRGLPVPDGLAELPRDTVLQRAVADHLAAGRHWLMRTGELPL